jgi:HAMP domain-containing protein
MLNRLRIWQKISLIAICFLFPIGVLLVFLLDSQGAQIEFSSKELDGTAYMRPLRKLVLDVSQHRELAAAVLAGDSSFKQALEKKGQEIEAGFAALEPIDAELNAQFLTSELLAQVKQNWQKLKQDTPTFKVQQSFDAHGKLLRNLFFLSHTVGNASNLILDPDVDSYYMMDAIIFKLPKLHEELSQARGHAMALLASGGQGEENNGRRQVLMALVVRAEDALQGSKDFVKFALDFNPKVETALRPLLADNDKSTKDFLIFERDRVISGSQPPAAADFLAEAEKVQVRQQKLWDASADMLDELVKARVANLQSARIKSLAIVGVSLIVTLLLILFVIRAISRPIAHLSQVADRISLGEMDAVISIESKDEVGELGERFRRMQVSLKAAMEQLEKDAGDL